MSPRRARLAARLKAIRAGVAPSGSEFARFIGWPQPRVSKLETGKQLPTEADIRAWVAAAGASESVAAELLGLLAAARIEYVTHRDESLHARGTPQLRSWIRIDTASPRRVLIRLLTPQYRG
ncbi:MAG: helix-turn-helix domain-containing protein [Pseudonocardiaceae bacterium]